MQPKQEQMSETSLSTSVVVLIGIVFSSLVVPGGVIECLWQLIVLGVTMHLFQLWIREYTFSLHTSIYLTIQGISLLSSFTAGFAWVLWFFTFFGTVHLMTIAFMILRATLLVGYLFLVGSSLGRYLTIFPHGMFPNSSTL